MRREAVWGALAGALAVAVALRFPFLGHQSLWYDEAYTASIAARGSPGGVWDGVRATESTPPLFYLLEWAWTHLAGSRSAAALRAVPAAAGVAAVPVAFLALRRLAGEAAALAAAWIAAAAPFAVWYALDARAYALFVLSALLSVWAWASVLERPRSMRRWAAWALAGAACLWTHYYAAFLLAAEVLVALWRLRDEWRRVLGWSALGAASFLPLLPLFSDQRGEGARADYIAATPLADRLEQLVREFAMGPNVPRAWLEAVGLALVAGGLVAGTIALRRTAPRGRELLALIAVSAAAPVVLAASSIDDHFLPRNLAFAWPLLAGVVGAGLLALRGRPLTAYLATGAVAALWIQADWRYQNADWRGATREIRAAATGRPVVVLPGIQATVAGPYLSRGLAPGPVAATEVWAVVEPERQGARELAPVGDAPPPGFPGPTFRLVAEREHRGFRLLLYRSPTPAPVDAAALGTDPRYAQPRALTLAP